MSADESDLTDADLRALRMLSTCRGLVRPGHFGTLLWPEKRRPTWAFARPGGNVLNRLRARGYAEWSASDREWGWRITDGGRARLR